MSHLHQRMFVKCSSNQAATHIAAFFNDHRPVDCRNDENAPVQLALRAPVMLPALKTEIVLQRDVVVTVARLADPANAIERMRVQWEPAGGGPFPRFGGTLSAEHNEDYDSFSLVLDGSYEPPLGLVGETFDVALGHRIAMATARELLGRVRNAVERSWEAVEFAKRARRDVHARGTTPS